VTGDEHRTSDTFVQDEHQLTNHNTHNLSCIPAQSLRDRRTAN
jgi:hypothetical protein